MTETSKAALILRRALYALILFGISVVFLKDCADDRARQAAREEERQRIRDAIDVLRTTYGASDSWQRQICGDDTMLIRPIMSLELEQEWITESPILFFGMISDIATADDDRYRVEFRQSVSVGQCMSLDTDLRLRVDCPRGVVDSLLATSPELLNELLQEVAVVARIERIESERLIAEDGFVSEARIGIGTCSALLDATAR